MTTDEAIAHALHDPKTITRELRGAASDHRWLEANWERLVKNHRREWIGVHRKQAIYGKSLNELVRKAKAKGWDPGTMLVDQLIPSRPARIL